MQREKCRRMYRRSLWVLFFKQFKMNNVVSLSPVSATGSSIRNSKTQLFLLMIAALFLLSSCGSSRKVTSVNTARKDVGKNTSYVTLEKPVNIKPQVLVDYAGQFLGTPYRYGSADPDKGFDCSGFVYHVLTHFGVQPPRASYQYKNVGRTIKRKKARTGDLILFRGTARNSNISHMGIITEVKDRKIYFIHASSPRSGGVIISELSGYYDKHFAKIVRILR